METSQRPNAAGGSPPPMVSMGTELGGGAMAWLQQQMWPVQGWRGGRRCAWQRGPAWDVAGLRLEQACGSGVHHLQEVPWIPRALGLALGAPGYHFALHPAGPSPRPSRISAGSGPP